MTLEVPLGTDPHSPIPQTPSIPHGGSLHTSYTVFRVNECLSHSVSHFMLCPSLYLGRLCNFTAQCFFWPLFKYMDLIKLTILHTFSPDETLNLSLHFIWIDPSSMGNIKDHRWVGLWLTDVYTARQLPTPQWLSGKRPKLGPTESVYFHSIVNLKNPQPEAGCVYH